MEDSKCLLDPKRDCFGLIKAREIERGLDDLREHNEKNHKEFFDRLAALEAHDKVQDAHYAHIIEKLTDITDKLSGLSARIAAIEIKPSKRWDGVVEKAILTVVGAAVLYMLAKMGIS